jgi:hypothetical protein
MRYFAIPVVASILLTTSAFAADPLALAPGKPAGIRAAQHDDGTPLIYFGLVAIGIGIALAVSNNSNGPVAGAPGTTTTSTTTTG